MEVGVIISANPKPALCRANACDLASEEVGDFAAQSDQRERVKGNDREGGYGARGIIVAFGGIPGDGAQHGDCDGVGGHPHVEDELCGVKIVDSQKSDTPRTSAPSANTFRKSD